MHGLSSVCSPLLLAAQQDTVQFQVLSTLALALQSVPLLQHTVYESQALFHEASMW